MISPLADIDVTDAEKAQDAMCVIDRALEEVSSTEVRLEPSRRTT